MDEKSNIDPRMDAWLALVALCCILFWNMGYVAAKFANGVPMEFGIMEVLALGCIAFLAGYVLWHRRYLR